MYGVPALVTGKGLRHSRDLFMINVLKRCFVCLACLEERTKLANYRKHLFSFLRIDEAVGWRCRNNRGVRKFDQLQPATTRRQRTNQVKNSAETTKATTLQLLLNNRVSTSKWKPRFRPRFLCILLSWLFTKPSHHQIFHWDTTRLLPYWGLTWWNKEKVWKF